MLLKNAIIMDSRFIGELKGIDEFISNTLRNVLYEKVPECKRMLDSQGGSGFASDYGIYLFMNEFAACLGNSIKEDSASDFVKNSFAYINLLGQSDNREILNIVHVGILEILYTENGVDRTWVKLKLSDKLQPYFESWSRYYS